MNLELRSTAFGASEPIPAKYAKDHENISPPIQWSGVPAQAHALALIVDDPDAPQAEPFVHWVLYDIPGRTGGLPEHVPPQPEAMPLAGAVQGKNSLNQFGYTGPAPPPGHGIHHYHFHLYALDEPLRKQPGLDKKALLAEMSGHILAEGDLVGTYAR